MRLLGQIFFALAILCFALVAAMLLLEWRNGCSMNWYGYDCPEYYRWVSVFSMPSILIGPLSGLLGGLLMWFGRPKT